jgi:Cu(I)/Ag(I) efflux system protein CusF
MKTSTTLAALTAILFASGALALAAPSARAEQNTASPAPKKDVAGEMSEGEIRKVDREAGKLTIRHGELKNLGMPAMTMVFRAQDPAMLERVKVGDKVKFVAENVNGTLTVVRLEPAS